MKIKDDTFFGWFVLKCIEKLGDKVTLEDISSVKLLINDSIELPAKEIFDSMDTHIADIIVKQSLDLLDTKLDEFVEFIEEVKEEIIIKAYSNLGVDLDYEDKDI